MKAIYLLIPLLILFAAVPGAPSPNKDAVFGDYLRQDILQAYPDKILVVHFFGDDRETALSFENGMWAKYRNKDVQIIGVSSTPHLAEGLDVSYRLVTDISAKMRNCTVVLDSDLNIAYSQQGYEYNSITSVIERLLNPTEVGKSTWGKIKELFR